MTKKKLDKNTIREEVYAFYDRVAKNEDKISVDRNALNRAIGYSAEDIAAIPDEANMGLGCGNPQEKAKPQKGETIIDLGCGKGMDVFLVSKNIEGTGHIIGIDKSYEMVEKARHISERRGFTNTEFRLGEVEFLPVADNTADLVMSNCVINLSTEKDQVYREIFRVLKTGGRIGISDIILQQPLPNEVYENPKMYGT